MSKVFGMFESTTFAKALAADEGVRVTQKHEHMEPYVQNRKTLVIGIPSIYEHDLYMEQLHSELSKVMRETQFFYDLEYKEDSLQEIIRRILQGQRTEYNMFGQYAGRDRILRNRYSNRVRNNGGISNVCSALGASSPTVGALMYCDCMLRNEWQGYITGDCPPELEDEVRRIWPIVMDSWLQLDSKKALETLIDRIIHEEEEEEQGEQDGEETGEGTGDSGEGSSGGRTGESEETGEPSGESPESTDESTGDDEGQSDKDEGDSSGGGDEAGGEGAGGGEPDNNYRLAEEELTGSRESTQGAENLTGGGSATQLADMGLIKDAKQVNDYEHKMTGADYCPSSAEDIQLMDITKGLNPRDPKVRSINQTLGTFSLSKKIRKYLLSVSQVGYDYGLKKGKLCNKNISRIYAGGNQPRIFKERQAFRIKQDTAVFILGDCSGSMGGTKYDTSAACQISASETLQALKIPHAMGMFSTGGSRIYHMVLKTFEDMFVSRDKLVDRYSDGAIRSGCNADGEAVVWAATELAKRKESNKILIVLSDGYPAHTRGDDEFLKAVVGDIRDNSSMHILGIGIMSEAVSSFYPEYRVVNKVEDLESVLLDLLKEKIIA